MLTILLLVFIQYTTNVILGDQTAMCIMKTAFGEKKGIAIFRQKSPNSPTTLEAKFIGLTPNTKHVFTYKLSETIPTIAQVLACIITHIIKIMGI
jgi:hypothetical protein